MRHFLFPLGFLLVAFTGAAADHGFIRVSRENPRYLEFTDGTPYIPIGANLCFERFETNEAKVLEIYDKRFASLAANGANYTRIWLGHDFFQVEHEKAGVYDERVARRIDRLLASAAKHGIKIKLCLEHFWQLTDVPRLFPGAPSFERPVYSVKNGGPFRTTEEFFTTEQGRKLYLDRVAFLASRYRDNTAIFGWELWNEGSPKYFAWTKTMLPAVKALCPNHMVMFSLSSLESPDWIKQYKKFAALRDNDIFHVHRYVYEGSPLAVCSGPMDVAASDAVSFLYKIVPDKPVLMAEVGAHGPVNDQGPFKYYAEDKLGTLLHDEIFAPFFSGAVGSGMSWHWDFYLEKNNLWWHLARFQHAISGIHPIAEQYTPSLKTQDNIRFYCLEGKTHTLVWCRDAASDWKTELVQKIAPAKRSEKLAFKTLGVDCARASAYDPWTDKETALSIENGAIFFEFTRSIVLRLAK